MYTCMLHQHASWRWRRSAFSWHQSFPFIMTWYIDFCEERYDEGIHCKNIDCTGKFCTQELRQFLSSLQGPPFSFSSSIELYPQSINMASSKTCRSPWALLFVIIGVLLFLTSTHSVTTRVAVWFGTSNGLYVTSVPLVAARVAVPFGTSDAPHAFAVSTTVNSSQGYELDKRDEPTLTW